VTEWSASFLTTHTATHVQTLLSVVESFKMNIETAVNAYMALIQRKTIEHYAKLGGIRPDIYSIEPGRKFLKVVQSGEWNRNVHAFIDKSTGALYKPASWKAPVKDARYNLLTDLPLLEQKFDPYGGYLYKGASK
jgi:hypothetical protein